MPRWTLEARQKQSEAIALWKPWDKSTGPVTDEGKAISRQNAYKRMGGERRNFANVCGIWLRWSGSDGS